MSMHVGDTGGLIKQTLGVDTGGGCMGADTGGHTRLAWIEQDWISRADMYDMLILCITV